MLWKNNLEIKKKINENVIITESIRMFFIQQ